jgi:hypothetical protein
MPLITWSPTTANTVVNPDGSLTKTNATTSYDGAGQSIERVDSSVGGYVEWTVDSTSRYIAGLTTDSTTNSYTDIQYSWFNYLTSYVSIFEKGVEVSSAYRYTPKTGDVLRIEIRGGLVRYYYNGSLKYVSTVIPTGTYEFDASIYTGSVSPVKMGSLIWTPSDYINFHDWNRIESNMSNLATYLNGIQYSVPTPSIVNDRSAASIDFLSSINRIEDNLEAIHVAFGITPPDYNPRKFWAVGVPFSFDDANRLENNTQILRTYGDLVFRSFRRSGALSCGDQGGLY